MTLSHHGEGLELFFAIAVPLVLDRAFRSLVPPTAATARPFLTFATARPPVPHTAEITLPALVTAVLAFSSTGRVSSVWDPNNVFHWYVRKPCSSKLAARTLRSCPVASPRTTAISLRPSRVALATTLKPLSQM